jgi:hypothetical protein
MQHMKPFRHHERRTAHCAALLGYRNHRKLNRTLAASRRTANGWLALSCFPFVEGAQAAQGLLIALGRGRQART